MYDVSKNHVRLDTSMMDSLVAKLAKLDEVAASQFVEELLLNYAETIEEDTIQAMAPSNLPAGGIYSTGQTVKSIQHVNGVMWEGSVAWVPIGFDFTKPGAGGYLISGTPKMRPVYRLNEMYRGKKYINRIYNDMFDDILDRIQDAWNAR